LHRLPLCTPPRLLCGLLPHGVVTFAIISQSYLIAKPRITAHAPVSMKAGRALWHTRVHTSDGPSWSVRRGLLVLAGLRPPVAPAQPGVQVTARTSLNSRRSLVQESPPSGLR
jgi:hypothetical protein